MQRLQETLTDSKMNLVKKVMPSIGFALMLGLLLLATLTGCNKTTQTSSQSATKIEPRGKAYFEFFDTVSYIYSYVGDSDELFNDRTDKVADILAEYHKLFDIYYEYTGINNLCTINKLAGGEPVQVDKKLVDFLLYCKDIYKLTEGKVNVMMGSVLSLWHDARTSDSPYLPQTSVLEEAGRHVSLDALEIDQANCTVRLTDPEASLDVGAIGKGYATEMAARYLEEQKISGYVLNIGGNVRIVGTKPSGEGWVTGIKDPKNPDSAFALKLNLANCSCVTSGEYERYFTVDGVRYSHIIDPATLQPATYFASVSVITRDSAYADSLSTALFCMSYEEGLELVSNLKEVECVWVFHDGEVKYTSGLEALIVK